MFFDEFFVGEKDFRRKQFCHAFFKELVDDFSEITVFPKNLREKLSENDFQILKVKKHFSGKSAEKMLLETPDGKKIETVLMKHGGRNTLCVSCQIGCGANCAFCATGALGLSRSLSAREIVEQFLIFARLLKKRFLEKFPDKKWNLADAPPAFRIRNVVFMGMGEPLHNFENVACAIEIFSDEKYLNLGAKRITVSTVGIAKNIPKLLALKKLPNLAVSLHAATDELRNQIVPTNLGFPLKKLFEYLDQFVEKTGRRIFYEWTVLRGVNDTFEQMDALGKLLRARAAHVNFIPVNPGPSRIKYRRPSIDHIRQMQKYLLETYGVPSTIRALYGDDVDGACGQLAAAEK